MKYIITALIIGYFVFLIIGIRMGHRPAEVIRMSIDGLRTAWTLMAILLLIGVLTGSWRSAGSIVTFVYYGIIMSNELMKDSYERKGKSSFDLAMDIENSSITIPALVPWCILISVPLSIFGVTHAAVPYAIYIYAIPLVHLAGKILRRDL